MNPLTPEQIKEHKKIAKEGSWLCGLFQEYTLNASEKKEILKLVFKGIKKGAT